MNADAAAPAEEALLDASDISERVEQLAQAIRDRHRGGALPALIGVYTRGATLARRLKEALERGASEGGTVQIGFLDVSLYRDDLDRLDRAPSLKGTEIAFPIEGMDVVLCDEVIFTGRTVKAALNQLLDYGRPGRVELAVLVDRGHRELPLQPDYVGLFLETARSDYVKVRFTEDDGREGIFLTH